VPINRGKAVVVVALVAVLSLPSPAAAAPARDVTEFLCPRTSEGPYTDVAGTTHEVAINCLTSLGVVSGTSATTFSPSDRVTRGQLATMIARAMALAGVPLDTSDAGYLDIGGTVHADAINALTNLGVLTGKRPRQFAPDDRATRAQMATIGARSLPEGTLDPSAPDAFVDDEGATAHEQSINQLAAVGIVTGVDAQHYEPDRPIGRGAVATIVARLLDFMIERGFVVPPTAVATLAAALVSAADPTARGSVFVVQGGLPGLLCVQWNIDAPFSSTPTAAHVHSPNGAVLLNLPPPAPSPRCVSDRNQQDIETLFADPAQHTVDVHTSSTSDAAVRGQLTTLATPLGTQLAPDGGAAFVDVYADGRTICVDIAAEGDGSSTIARLRRGDNAAIAVPVRGCVLGDTALVADIATNPASWSVEAQTNGFPADGALERSRLLSADLGGGEEVPGPGDTDGFGDALVDVVGDGLMCVMVSAQRVDRVTAAHIHRGAQGVAGPVVVPLPAPVFGHAGGCIDADPALVADVVADPSQFYVNVHTAAFPSGAIRGQLAEDAA
jgi:hypothetical protein